MPLQTDKKFRYFAIRLNILVCLLLSISLSYATDDISSGLKSLDQSSEYSKGLQAFINGDYELSQRYWLNAAKNNDARSMFNLGLLHQHNKINGADIDKAENWFQLASKHGYVAADYHLAKLKIETSASNDVNPQTIQALLQRAANNGYLPAQEMLSEKYKGVVSNKTTYLTEQSIAQKESSNWTIQILAFENKNKVHEFIDRYQLNESASYFTQTSQGEILYKLIYGSYQSKQEAEKARDDLSPDLKQYGPWLRTIASVQALIDAN